MEKLLRAAEHAGFRSPAEFCEAVVKSGLLAKEAPNAERFLDRRSLEEVGKFLCQRMEVQTNQGAWFKKLSRDQKGALVCSLMQKGHAPPAIARALNCSETDVRETWAAYSDELGKTVTGIRASTVIGDLTARRDELYQRAIDAGNYSLAWRIQKDYTASLQDFGIIEKAVIRQEITHKLDLDEVAEEELEALVDVRQKRRTARLEIAKLKTPEHVGPDATTQGGEGEEQG